MTITKEQRQAWRNIWCILHSLDLHELRAAGASDDIFFHWESFRADPHRYVLRTDDFQAAAIWAAVEKRMPKGSNSNDDQSAKELSRTKVGVRVECATCGLTKKPVGRDAPMAVANAYCDHECSGCYDDPQVGSLWPGESEYDFGYQVGDAGTEERPWLARTREAKEDKDDE